MSRKSTSKSKLFILIYYLSLLTPNESPLRAGTSAILVPAASLESGRDIGSTH